MDHPVDLTSEAHNFRTSFLTKSNPTFPNCRLAGLFRHHLANTTSNGGAATVVVDGRGAPVAAHSSQRPDSTAAAQVGRLKKLGRSFYSPIHQLRSNVLLRFSLKVAMVCLGS